MMATYNIIDFLMDCIKECHYSGDHRLPAPEFDHLIYSSLVEYAHGDNNARD